MQVSMTGRKKVLAISQKKRRVVKIKNHLKAPDPELSYGETTKLPMTRRIQGYTKKGVNNELKTQPCAKNCSTMATSFNRIQLNGRSFVCFSNCFVWFFLKEERDREFKQLGYKRGVKRMALHQFHFRLRNQPTSHLTKMKFLVSFESSHSNLEYELKTFCYTDFCCFGVCCRSSPTQPFLYQIRCCSSGFPEYLSRSRWTRPVLFRLPWTQPGPQWNQRCFWYRSRILQVTTDWILKEEQI